MLRFLVFFSLQNNAVVHSKNTSFVTIRQFLQVVFYAEYVIISQSMVVISFHPKIIILIRMQCAQQKKISMYFVSRVKICVCISDVRFEQNALSLHTLYSAVTPVHTSVDRRGLVRVCVVPKRQHVRRSR